MDDLFVVHSISRIRFKDSSRARWWYAAELVFIDLYKGQSSKHRVALFRFHSFVHFSPVPSKCNHVITLESTPSPKGSWWSCHSMGVLKHTKSERKSSSSRERLNRALLLQSSLIFWSIQRTTPVQKSEFVDKAWAKHISFYSASLASSMNRWCVVKSMAIQRVRFQCFTARAKTYGVYDIKGIECDHWSNVQTSNMLFLLWLRSIAVDSSEERLQSHAWSVRALFQTTLKHPERLQIHKRFPVDCFNRILCDSWKCLVTWMTPSLFVRRRTKKKYSLDESIWSLSWQTSFETLGFEEPQQM